MNRLMVVYPLRIGRPLSRDPKPLTAVDYVDELFYFSDNPLHLLSYAELPEDVKFYVIDENVGGKM